MRKNIELKKEWLHKIRYCDEYKIVIFMMFCDDELTLNVSIDIDGEQMTDYECIMVIEGTENPTKEMIQKFKSLEKYFKQHFENVQANEIAIHV